MHGVLLGSLLGEDIVLLGKLLSELLLSEFLHLLEEGLFVIGQFLVVHQLYYILTKMHPNHLRFYYLLPGIIGPSRFRVISPMAFTEVLLMLLLTIVLTFGSLTAPTLTGLRMLLPLLFMIAVLLVATGTIEGLAIWFWLEEGKFVLRFLVFLLSLFFSSFLFSFSFSSLNFSASLKAVALAIFLIC